jgi:hypothetical protein
MKHNDKDYEGVLIFDRSLSANVEHLAIKGAGRTLCGSPTRFKKRRRFLWIAAIGCYACRGGYSATAKSYADHETTPPRVS